MIGAFEFATATRIVFGAGKAGDAPQLVREVGAQRVLLVTGANPARADRLRAGLNAAGIETVDFLVPGEPTVDLVREGVALSRARACDGVVAQGGGSAIDGAKAIAALAPAAGDPTDHIEVVGRGLPLARAPLPFVAIPTTAGTGSEVTRNAVLGSPVDRVKASVRSPLMLPRVAIVDPDLLIGLPPAVIASGGLDALSQLIEPFLSVLANPLTDALAREGIKRSARSLRRAYEAAPGVVDAQVREDLALASLAGGLCLANAGLGAVHGFAAPLGGMFDAPHGAVCAALLVAVLDTNQKALSSRAPEHPALARITEVAVLVTGDRDACAADGLAWIDELRQALHIPGLSRYGLDAAGIPSVVQKAEQASSMKKNPIQLTTAELTAILEQSL